MGCVNVQKTDLIRPGGIIGAGCLDRIARVTQTYKVHTFDDAAIGDIKTGYQTGFQHSGTSWALS